MKAVKRLGLVFAALAGMYLLLPLAIFDFTSTAVPHDEETFQNKKVIIGPQPYWFVPAAAWDIDVPGGFSYSTVGWPFRVWKPLCMAYIKMMGYAPPSQWR